MRARPSWRRVAAAIACAGILAAVGSGCGGSASGASDSPDPASIQRFVALQSATTNMTHLTQLMSTVDDTATLLAKASPTSQRAANLLQGIKLGWNNVDVGVGFFTPGQTSAVPGLLNYLISTRQLSTQWQTAAAAATPLHERTTHAQLARHFARPVRLQKANREQLLKVAKRLAVETCTLEQAHPSLVGPSRAVEDCSLVGVKIGS